MTDIRQAGPDDLAEVERVVAAAYSRWIEVMGGARPVPMDSDYAALVAADEVWVVEKDGAVAAILVLRIEPDHLLLENIAVDPAAQGQGLGARLLAHVDDYARRQGRTSVLLYTNVLMTSNVAWYEHHGYVETGREGTSPRRRVFLVKSL